MLERGSQRGAKFAYARLLLRRGDESAIGMLDQVTLVRPETAFSGCALIADYLFTHGREADGKPYINRYHNRQQAIEHRTANRELVGGSRVSDRHGHPEHALGLPA